MEKDYIIYCTNCGKDVYAWWGIDDEKEREHFLCKECEKEKKEQEYDNNCYNVDPFDCYKDEQMCEEND